MGGSMKRLLETVSDRSVAVRCYPGSSSRRYIAAIASLGALARVRAQVASA